MFKWAYALIAAVVLAVSFPSEAMAQRSSGGGHSSTPSRSPSSSRPSSPSRSTPSASRPSSPSKSSPAVTPSSGGSSSSRQASSSSGSSSSRSTTATTTAPKLSAADQALYERAKQQGTTFTSRDSAVSAFKTKYASEFTSSFASEPSVRPSYIPSTYSMGGTSYNVIYRPAYGYGYWAGPTWYMYDAFSDGIMLGSLMSQRGYYYGPSTAYYGGAGAISGTFLLVFLGIVIVIVAIVIIAAMIESGKKNRKSERFEGSYKPSYDPSAPVVKTHVQSPQAVAESKEVRAMGEVGNIAFWRDIPPGTVVTLTDKSALEMSQAAGRGLEGMEYTIEEVININEINNLCEWIIANMVCSDGAKLSLLIKAVGENLDIRAMYVPNAMQPGGNREDMVRDHDFIFGVFEAGTPYTNLMYAQEFDWIFNWDDIGEQSVHFAKKGGLEFAGRAFYNPPRFGGDALLATIAEYQATEDCREPEIAIIEVGKHDNERGGFILFMVGNPINVEEVNVLVKA